MSDAWSFFLVLSALYALECFAAIPRFAVMFSGARGRARVMGANTRFGSRRFAVAFADPWVPWRANLVVPLAPLSLGAKGVLAFAGHAWNPGPRLESSCAFTPFEAPFDARAIDGAVVIRGIEPVDLGSSRAATRWAGWIRQTASEPPERRSASIAEIVNEQLSDREARRRLDAFARQTRALGVSSAALAAILILGVPAVVAVRGLAASWLWLLAGVLTAHVATVALAVGARLGLAREGLEISKSRLVSVALSPVSASRAMDSLGRDLLADLHPLAVAKAVCSDVDFRDIARRVRADLTSPILPFPKMTYDAKATESQFRRLLLPGVERLAGRGGRRGPVAAENDPAREDAHAVCPRCATRYTSIATACSDCGVRLEPVNR